MINFDGLHALELPLVLLGGLLGSSHCIGMCGGFAVAVGYGADGVSSNLRRQFAWSLGRVVTYSFGGAVLGFLGSRIDSGIPWTSMQAVLAILAGVLLIGQGMISSGYVRQLKPRPGKCPIVRYSWLMPIGRLLKPPQDSQGSRSPLAETFLAGLMTGFLPCGLVYAYLALAAASAQLWSGLMIMAVFGLGTMPVMIATGAGASLLSLKIRARVFRIAALCVVVTGILTVSRGVMAFEINNGEEPYQCPMCQPIETAPADSMRNR